jgi:hypothetical protein
VKIDAEIVVRASGAVVQEAFLYDGPDASAWTEHDVRAILIALLRALDRAASRGSHADGPIRLRGLSWIVTPFDAGAAVAIEITAGSIVAGPFAIPDATLSRLVARAIDIDGAGTPS